jgi:hypothetical protein
MSDKGVWASLHPDALELFNVTMDMARVCAELRDPRVPMKRTVSARAACERCC